MDTALTYVILRPHRQPGSRGRTRTDGLPAGATRSMARRRAAAEKTRYAIECDIRVHVRPTVSAAVDLAGGKCVRVHIPSAEEALISPSSSGPRNGHAALVDVDVPSFVVLPMLINKSRSVALASIAEATSEEEGELEIAQVRERTLIICICNSGCCANLLI